MSSLQRMGIRLSNIRTGCFESVSDSSCGVSSMIFQSSVFKGKVTTFVFRLSFRLLGPRCTLADRSTPIKRKGSSRVGCAPGFANVRECTQFRHCSTLDGTAAPNNVDSVYYTHKSEPDCVPCTPHGHAVASRGSFRLSSGLPLKTTAFPTLRPSRPPL